MSPLPDRSFQPPESPLSKPIPSDEQLSAMSDSTKGVPLSNSSDGESPNPTPDSEADSTPLVPKRPLMRPVSRPQPPAQPASPPKSAVSPVASQKAELSKPVEPVATPAAAELLDEQASLRQQPIPPPSEPKQYRAIGLVRGQYSPSEEQFTRGEMKTADGTAIEAVLLGRVMSLVRNHLDLAEDHLWVVYPRTREMQDNLHVQIVGVWEPEKLSKGKEQDDDTESGDTESGDTDAPVDTAQPEAETSEADLSPGYEDDYFSIRGEVVFYAPDEKQVVVKIQQAARKSSSKAKAFKLQLEGVLPSSKTLGYFWDLQVKRIGAVLVITEGTAIGLVPPRKKPKSEFRKDRRPFKPREHRPGGTPSPRGTGASAPPPSRREPPPKPVKRSDQGSES